MGGFYQPPKTCSRKMKNVRRTVFLSKAKRKDKGGRMKETNA
jgi:hypothetical protein